MYIKRLTELDFTTGIRSEIIDDNFEQIYQWIIKERLRTSGWGIVDGFDLSGDTTNFTVTIGAGKLINEDGEEVSIDSKTIYVGPPESIEISETLTVSDEGVVLLKFNPYSNSRYGFISYNPPYHNQYPLTSEISITDKNTASNVPILSIVDKYVTVNANDWANREIIVTYKYSKNRIDSILISKNGEYKYEKGIISTSPSHIDFDDYENYYIIGVAYWTISDFVSVDFFTGDRTYRKVYVDESNKLYLNGKLYIEPQFIYFSEPAYPIENDLWYDNQTNTLYIWREKDGEFGWHVINDMSSIPLKVKKIWSPGDEDYPADLQTFLFKEDEPNLRYLPNVNALEIILDNSPLTMDQFTEIIEDNGKDYLSDGIGFKLKAPLDREATVEVTILHVVRTAPLRETFQRAAIFVDENFVPFNILNTEKIFNTSIPYVIGEQQLEIFLNGKRLQRDIEFVELTKDGANTGETDRGSMSSTFKLLCDIESGDSITHKITRYVWSYDHLDLLIKEIETKANIAIEQVEDMHERFDNFNKNITQKFATQDIKIENLDNKIPSSDDFLTVDSIISEQHLSNTVIKKLFNSRFDIVIAANETLLFENFQNTDFYMIFYISNGQSNILIKDLDYYVNTEIINDEHKTSITLRSDLVNSSAELYITGFSVGV